MVGCRIPAAGGFAGCGRILPWTARLGRWQGLAVALALLLAVLAARPQAGTLDLARLQQAAARLGARAERPAAEVRDLVVRLAALDDATRLARVNEFVNRRVVFGSDASVWGQEDYWASPLEVLVHGEGDCEDYAIAKYFILVASGTPPARLRLVYVRATLPAAAGQPAGNQAHMVLAHYADNAAEPAILDNLVADIRQASRRPDLTPVFSFNSEGLWNGAGPQSAGDPLARLSRWRDVLQRARAEGFQ